MKKYHELLKKENTRQQNKFEKNKKTIYERDAQAKYSSNNKSGLNNKVDMDYLMSTNKSSVLGLNTLNRESIMKGTFNMGD